jgi:uncharacterized protein
MEAFMQRTFCATVVAVVMSTILVEPAFALEKKAVKVLIITGDHGHDWRKTTPFLKELLQKAGHQVDVTETPGKDLTADNLARYDVLLFNYRNTPQGAKGNPASVWSDQNKNAFLEAVKGGVGLVVYHHASAAFVGDSAFDRQFEQITLGGWRKQGFHGKMHEFTVTVRKEHPITLGISEFKHGRDELYQNSLVTKGSEVLATAYSEPSKDPRNTGKHEPILWVSTFGKGRICNYSLGHDVEAMQGDGFKTLLLRSIEWAGTGRVYTELPESLKSKR